MIPATSLPACPQCGAAIRQAERIGVSAAVEPCGHFIPAEFFRPSTVEASVQQELVADGGQSEERHCTTCGKSLDGAAYELWLFYTCRSCAAEPAPGRWSAGMAPGTAVKWAYTPRWHIDEHPESNHHIVADGGVERCELHLNPDRGLWIPPELREFTRQIIFRTPRATIQHFGSQPLDPYYGMIDASHFGDADEFRDAKNPELAPDRVRIKPQGEDAVEFDLRSLNAESDQGGDPA